MSRTRIIGGKLTEIIGGDYNIYSTGNIVYNSAKTITFTGEENGVVFGEPKDPPVIKKNIPKKNIYIVLDYDSKKGNDKNRETIEFKDLEHHEWYGIYAMNIQDAIIKLTIYLQGNKANNVVLETHGAPQNYYDTQGNIIGNGVFIITDNNAYSKLSDYNLEQSINGTNNKNQFEVDALVKIVNSIKNNGNFFLAACNTADCDKFFHMLNILSNDKVNLYGSADQCFARFDIQKSRIAVYEPKYLMNRDFISDKHRGAGIKLYQAGCSGQNPIPYKDIQINQDGFKTINW